jgi:hypothetical protein
MNSIFKKLTVISTIYLITINCSIPVFAASSKKDPCLKNNNGIGNNHDIFVELPTHSQFLNDSQNQILSIRIDPGNSGQVNKFKTELEANGFDNTAIDFVVAQLWDAEIKVKQTNLQCYLDEPMEKDYTFVAD